MPVILLFVHGWDFDASFWNDLADLLPDWRSERADRGYFGTPRDPQVADPVIAVAHSFGAMRILRDPPPKCRGLVAVNGFDCFAARAGFAGVAPRVLDRMVARFDEDPEAVLSDFHRRCGSDAPFGAPCPQVLRQDLLALRDMDCRAASARAGFPILSLQGAKDPILPPAMRDAVFAAAPRVERLTHPAAGHLLPLTDSAYCARAIGAFVEHAA